MCKPRVSTMIYHKFTHGATWENVNIMLEFMMMSSLRQFISGYTDANF